MKKPKTTLTGNDAVHRHHEEQLARHAEKVREAIDAKQRALVNEALDDAGEPGQRARRELAELAEYTALRDYFAASESARAARGILAAHSRKS